jgi:pimeloyl-ACP methyl ester carboxylesterase
MIDAAIQAFIDRWSPPAGAEPYKRDLKTLDFHLIDAGHFALETNTNEIATLMRDFLDKHIESASAR